MTKKMRSGCWPDFANGVSTRRALAQRVGSMVMRVAAADLLPFEFTNFADTVQTYVTNLKKLLKTQQDETRERNRQIEDGVFNSVEDQLYRLATPVTRVVPPYFNFAPLDNALAAMTKSADEFSGQLARIRAGNSMPDPETLAKVNALLMQSGPKLTDEAGLPGRPWYRNQIYAPGAYGLQCQAATWSS